MKKITLLAIALFLSFSSPNSHAEISGATEQKINTALEVFFQSFESTESVEKNLEKYKSLNTKIDLLLTRKSGREKEILQYIKLKAIERREEIYKDYIPDDIIIFETHWTWLQAWYSESSGDFFLQYDNKNLIKISLTNDMGWVVWDLWEYTSMIDKAHNYFSHIDIEARKNFTNEEEDFIVLRDKNLFFYNHIVVNVETGRSYIVGKQLSDVIIYDSYILWILNAYTSNIIITVYDKESWEKLWASNTLFVVNTEVSFEWADGEFIYFSVIYQWEKTTNLKLDLENWELTELLD